MTSFNESDVSRDASGKFAARTTSESNLDLGDVEVPYYNSVTKTYAAMSFDDQHAWQLRARDEVDAMPKSHAVALRRHAGETFHRTTAYLRGEPGAKPVGSAHVAALDKAIERGNVGESVVFRGIRLPRTSSDDLESVRAAFPVGETVSDLSFISTSSNPQAAMTRTGVLNRSAPTVPVVMQIRSSAGVHVPSDDWWEETETLLPRDAPLRVEAIHTDRTFLDGMDRPRSVVVVELTHEA